MRILLKPFQWIYCIYAIILFVVLMLPVFLLAILASPLGSVKGGNIIYRLWHYWPIKLATRSYLFSPMMSIGAGRISLSTFRLLLSITTGENKVLRICGWWVIANTISSPTAALAGGVHGWIPIRVKKWSLQRTGSGIRACPIFTRPVG